MGPVDWIAVSTATLAAGLLAYAWFVPAFGRVKSRNVTAGRVTTSTPPVRVALVSGGLLLVTATMLGHMFARVGPGTLGAKPWLYFMMSGGLAAAFVIPALWISFSHMRIPARAAIIDAGYWLSAYLLMGLVFYLLA